MALQSRLLDYQADGLSMVGSFYYDASLESPRPGILVFPEAFGVSDHARSCAQRLAALGYPALACDLHGEALLLTDLDEALGRLEAVRDNPVRVRARAQGALDALIAQEEVNPAKTAAIGYCFGGAMALELARSGAPVAAAVGIHSRLATGAPQDAAAIAGKVLVCIGADDPAVPLEQRIAFEEEMRAGGVDWRMHIYGGVVHSFTNPQADQLGRPAFARYDSSADERSWAEMTALLNEVF